MVLFPVYGILNKMEGELNTTLIMCFMLGCSFNAFCQQTNQRYYFQEKNKQNTGISFTGVIKEISKEENRGEVFFDLKIKMTLRNNSDQDIILLAADPLCEVLFAADTYENAVQERYIHEENMGPSDDSTNDIWKQRRKFLDSHLPPNEIMLILKKGESKDYLIDLPLFFKKEYFVKRPREEEREILWSEAEKIKTLYLRVVFHTWNANLEEGWYSAKSKFGKKLQKKWTAIGNLYLDDIITDPIEVSLLPTNSDSQGAK